MSCDHESINDRARCAEKDSSYITIKIIKVKGTNFSGIVSRSFASRVESLLNVEALFYCLGGSVSSVIVFRVSLKIALVLIALLSE